MAANPLNTVRSVIDLSDQVVKKLGLALKNLKIWWDGNKTPANPGNKQESFFERPQKSFSVWNPRQLEYDFKVKITPTDTSKKLILDASGYKEDHPDWYNFAVSEVSADLELPPPKP